MASLAKLNVDSTPGALWNLISFTAGDLNSLASGGGALGSTVITNSTYDDLLIDFSFTVTVGGTTTSSSIVSASLLPLNQDGTHYGDNYASASGSQPALGYQAGWINVLSGITSGNAVYGNIEKCPLAPGDYKVAFNNSLGVALNATAALTLKYRIYNLNLNG